MKKRLIILAACTLMAALISGPVSANPVQADHRICERDEDCSIIDLHCNCKGLTCLQDEDIDAVNRKYAEQYKNLGQCTISETQSCAQSGACAWTKTPMAACKNQQCAVIWQPARP